MTKMTNQVAIGEVVVFFDGTPDSSGFPIYGKNNTVGKVFKIVNGKRIFEFAYCNVGSDKCLPFSRKESKDLSEKEADAWIKLFELNKCSKMVVTEPSNAINFDFSMN